MLSCRSVTLWPRRQKKQAFLFKQRYIQKETRQCLKSLINTSTPTHLLGFIIRVLPVAELVGGEREPAPMPRTEPGHVLEHREEAALLHVLFHHALETHVDHAVERRQEWNL